MAARDSLLQLATRLQQERLLRLQLQLPLLQQQQLAGQVAAVGGSGLVGGGMLEGAFDDEEEFPPSMLQQLQMYSQMSRWVCGYVDRSEDARFEATPVIGGATQQQVG